jgi:hypothetical protein
MHLFLMKISGIQTDPVGHEATTAALDTRRFTSDPPNLSPAVDPLGLPTLRSLLLGSRFTAGLMLYLDALSLYAGYGVYDL